MQCPLIPEKVAFILFRRGHLPILLDFFPTCVLTSANLLQMVHSKYAFARKQYYVIMHYYVRSQKCSELSA